MGKRNVDPAICNAKLQLLKVKLQYSILNGHQWLASYYSCFNTKEKIHGTNMTGTRMGLSLAGQQRNHIVQHYNVLSFLLQYIAD
jgi:hypothetical protein